MSITANFYTFSKRENSTAQPSGGTTFDIVLKDDCSVISPTIKLATTNPTAYNYAYISDFGRYYFVSDWTSNNNGLWTAHLTCDVLATYKSQIGAAEEYVLRSASEWDEWIKDTIYPTEADPNTTISAKDNVFDTLYYVVGIINGGQVPKFGAVSYYVFSSSDFRSFMAKMLGDASYCQWQDGGQPVDINLVKSTYNPIEYITECYALPYQPTTFITGCQLVVGWYTVDSNASYSVLDPSHPVYSQFGLVSPIHTGTITLPVHGQAATRGKYLYGEPYSRYIFNAGCFGDIVLDANLLTKVADNGGSIEYRIYGDCFGSISMDVYGVYSNIKIFLSRERANVKMPFPIGQVNNNPMQFWTSTLMTAGNIASAASSIPSGNVSGVVSSIASAGSGIMSGVQSLFPHVQKSGSQASIHEALLPFNLVGEFHHLVDEDLPQRGRPLCKVKTISSLSGYILVSDPDIHISGTLEENIKVKQYMASGFFYE